MARKSAKSICYRAFKWWDQVHNFILWGLQHSYYFCIFKEACQLTSRYILTVIHSHVSSQWRYLDILKELVIGTGAVFIIWSNVLAAHLTVVIAVSTLVFYLKSETSHFPNCLELPSETQYIRYKPNSSWISTQECLKSSRSWPAPAWCVSMSVQRFPLRHST